MAGFAVGCLNQITAAYEWVVRVQIFRNTGRGALILSEGNTLSVTAMTGPDIFSNSTNETRAKPT